MMYSGYNTEREATMKDNIFKVSVKTTISSGSKITQKCHQEFNDQKDNFIRTVFDTQEKQLKEALIKLGWTPPK